MIEQKEHFHGSDLEKIEKNIRYKERKYCELCGKCQPTR